jgi:peptidoglycan/xylan/chitin deacetylase (PgdA/CDA1 family)
VYHNITPFLFEKHIQILKKKYNFITLNDFYNFKEGVNTKLPEKSLIITFDDGFKENYLLLPILKKYNIRITIFLIAGVINTRKKVWSQYEEVYRNLFQYINLPNVDKDNLLKKENINVDLEFDFRSFLSSDEINEMKPYANFQSHSFSHPNLIKCSEIELFRELSCAKDIIENICKAQVNTVCYPFSIFNSKVIEMSKQIGYKYGVTVKEGVNSLDVDNFMIKRISINNAKVELVLLKATGFYYFIKEKVFRKKNPFYETN